MFKTLYYNFIPAIAGIFFLIYFARMKRIIFIIFYLTFYSCLPASAQTENVPVASNTTQANRTKEFNNLVYNINKNISITLTDSTEDNWQDAFYAMELINYHTPLVDATITTAFDSLERRSSSFQRAFLELVNECQ